MNKEIEALLITENKKNNTPSKNNSVPSSVAPTGMRFKSRGSRNKNKKGAKKSGDNTQIQSDKNINNNTIKTDKPGGIDSTGCQ
jgi:hypothetical protein